MAKHKYIESPEKKCIDCNLDISYKKSNNSKRCTKCTRKKHINLKKIINRGKLITPIKQIILRIYDNKCAICKWQATDYLFINNNKKYNSYGCEIHHIVSVSKGGIETEDNLILLCPNHHKQADMGILSKETLKKYQITIDHEQWRLDNSGELLLDSIY